MSNYKTFITLIWTYGIQLWTIIKSGNIFVSFIWMPQISNTAPRLGAIVDSFWQFVPLLEGEGVFFPEVYILPTVLYHVVQGWSTDCLIFHYQSTWGSGFLNVCY